MAIQDKKKQRPQGDAPARPAPPKRRRGGAAAKPEAPRDGAIRLQKIVSSAGITSRRKAEDLILAGRIAVNGKVVTELGVRADPVRDVVTLDGERLRQNTEDLVYLMMHKPRGTLCSASDAEGRDSVYRLLPPGLPRVFSVGRLDVQSEGLLLLTNDGDLSHRLTHPRHHVPKQYDVKIQGVLTPDAHRRIEEGIVLDGRPTLPVVVEADRRAEKNAWYRFTLLEGRNRQIRRMCEAVGARVLRIRRIRIGPLWLGDLPLGAVRRLEPFEVSALERAVAGD